MHRQAPSFSFFASETFNVFIILHSGRICSSRRCSSRASFLFPDIPTPAERDGRYEQATVHLFSFLAGGDDPVIFINTNLRWYGNWHGRGTPASTSSYPCLDFCPLHTLCEYCKLPLSAAHHQIGTGSEE